MKPNEKIIYEGRASMALSAAVGLLIGGLLIGGGIAGLCLAFCLWASIAILCYGLILAGMGWAALRSAVGPRPFTFDEEETQ